GGGGGGCAVGRRRAGARAAPRRFHVDLCLIAKTPRAGRALRSTQRAFSVNPLSRAPLVVLKEGPPSGLNVAVWRYSWYWCRHRSAGPVGRVGVVGVEPSLERRTGKGGVRVGQQAAVLPDLVVGVARVGDALDPQ